MRLRHSSSVSDISCRPFLSMHKLIWCFPNTNTNPFLTLGNRHGQVAFNVTHTAHLQRIERGGRLSYAFTVQDSRDFLIARAMRREDNSIKGKHGDIWMYTFHFKSSKERARKQGWKAQGKGKEMDLDLIGKMNVSSFLCHDDDSTTTNNGTIRSLIEFQFVLSDGKEGDDARSKHTAIESLPCQENLWGSEPSPSTSMSSDMRFHTMKGYKPQPTHRHQTFPPQPLKSRASLGVKSDVNYEISSNARKFSNHELAAFVIRIPCREQEVKSHRSPIARESLGWGLKVLDKISDTSAKIDCQRSENKEYITLGGVRRDGMKEEFEASLNGIFDLSVSNSNQHSRSNDISDGEYVIVLFPAGDHGIPMDLGSGGASSSLIEQWQSGGKCVCGGWDLGCGVTVLGTHKVFSKQDIEPSKTNNSKFISIEKPVSIYFKANKKSTQAVRLGFICKGLYSIKFLATKVSPLQAFAMGIAILHSRDPIHFPSSTRGSWSTFGKMIQHHPSKKSKSLKRCTNNNTNYCAIMNGPEKCHQISSNGCLDHSFGRS